ncbi:hypothetical protein ANCCAN_26445 [Ancylostoma caninum]|uniref:Uncharacterized protein n=1 Tax=Ancylostoma caninum TaxID=29170 RepID=A0A368F8D0_ANCCA|nr:hypothetical protein ANCCAN_26445 [Ancylostoma caninum]
MEESVQAIAPVESCESSCITIFEPQYFGGLRSPQRPYLFLRGCSSRLLSAMESPPREVDFLHRAAICVSLPLSQIYPKVYTNEVVEVSAIMYSTAINHVQCDRHLDPSNISSNTLRYERQTGFPRVDAPDVAIFLRESIEALIIVKFENTDLSCRVGQRCNGNSRASSSIFFACHLPLETAPVCILALVPFIHFRSV